MIKVSSSNGYLIAIKLISTLTLLGKQETSTVSLAGGFVGKYFP
jgi:hypothetical protein